MLSRRPRAELLALAGVVVALTAGVGGGCYNPKVRDGGFQCADAGTACPDGFTCSPVDHRCHKHEVPVTPDAGEPMCSLPPLTPLCADPPRTKQVCNPACQQGCDCGKRCNVDGDGNAQCVVTGAAKVGDVCVPGAKDNCGAGLDCLQEPCGNGLARCYKHCNNSSQCDGDTRCQIVIQDSAGKDTQYAVCDLPGRTCDPINNSGCPDHALTCYLAGANQTLCDCPGSAPRLGVNGDPCMLYSDCAAGFVCIAGADGMSGPRCRFACLVSAPSCPSSSTGCVPAGTGAMYGYCAS